MNKFDFVFLVIFIIFGSAIIGIMISSFYESYAYDLNHPEFTGKLFATRDNDLWIKFDNSSISKYHLSYTLSTGLEVNDTISFHFVFNHWDLPNNIIIDNIIPRELNK